MSRVVVECQALQKNYHDGQNVIEVLKDIQLSVNSGESVAIVGPSGSGKSTLLHLLGGLDKPTKGQVQLDGVDWQMLSEKHRCQLRNRSLGFVYQFHHLLSEFTALENVALPLILAHKTVEYAEQKAELILEKVGLAARLKHKPAQLSGGERQRVAIARALVHQPACVFADEPTGNLDHKTAMSVFDLMLSLNQQHQSALVIVTHDRDLASRLQKAYLLLEGRLTPI